MGALLLLAASGLAAQTVQRLERATSFRKDPGGTELAVLDAGARVATGRTNGAWISVTLDGWIWAPSVGRTTREGFNLVVTATGGENLRGAPNGGRIARVAQGMLLERRTAQGGWMRVRRQGWVQRSAFGGAAAPAAAAQAPDTTPAAPPPASAAARATAGQEEVRAATATTLAVEPGGEAVGRLEPGARGEVVARSGEWAKLRIEAWVPAADLRPAAAGALRGVSAAEVRADPERFVGQALEWRLQLISIQVADDLRPELPAGERYLLTRGPLPEAGFVYVIVPTALLPRFQGMAPLTEFTARGVLRAAQTRFLPTPVFELVEVGG